MDNFTIISVNTSKTRGEKKAPVEKIFLEVDQGIRGDAHAGPGHRQISLLATESIDKLRQQGLELQPGAFAENITTQGIDFSTLTIGTKLQLGEALVKITQFGKECHDRCAIYKQTGACVMPKEGVFAKVILNGTLHAKDTGSVKTN